MAKKKLRVGIGGYGRSGCDIHARWLREAGGRYKIVAVSDELPERRAEAAGDFGCAVYRDYRKLIEETEMDLFVNALPSFLHSKGAIEALEAGHNVVCEKPAARTVKDFDKMVAAAQKAGRLFAPFQNSRFYPFFQKMREVIASGVFGEIMHIQTIWGGFGRRWDWQTRQDMGGGNLLNTGPHPVDHAVMLFGKEQPKVFCRMRSIQPFGGDAEDFCAVTLYGDNAPVIEILLSSYLAYPMGEMYNISGTYGGMAGGPAGLQWKYFDPKKAPKQKMWKGWSENRRYCGESLPWVEKSWKPRPTKHDAFQLNSRAFYNNIYDVLVNGAELVVKPEQVRRQIAIIEECHRQNPLTKRRYG